MVRSYAASESRNSDDLSANSVSTTIVSLASFKCTPFSHLIGGSEIGLSQICSNEGESCVDHG